MDMQRSTDRVRMVISLAAKSAYEHGRKEISPEDLLEGLFDTSDINSGVGLAAIRETGNDINELRANLGYNPVSKEDLDAFKAAGHTIPLSKETSQLLELANDEARKINHNYIGTEHLTLALLRSGKIGEERRQILAGKGIKYDAILRNTQILLGDIEDPNMVDVYDSLDKLVQGNDFNGANNQLQSLRINSLSSEEIFDCLLATHGHTNELSYRLPFYQQAKEEMTKRGEYKGKNQKLLEILSQ